MPELPEVEGVRRSLEPHLLGSAITAIHLHRDDFLLPCGYQPRQLIGLAFTQTHRHGKKLFCSVGDGPTLLVHLGMSGRVDCVPLAAPVLSHTHVTVNLANGLSVRFRDPRRFGGLWLYDTRAHALEAQTAALGPDALTLTRAHLAHFAHSTGRLKARLLSQRDVAGLGNIYVDESLWMTGLHPLQLVRRIPPDALAKLIGNIRLVLRRSIRAGGTSFRSYRNALDEPGAFLRKLQVYGRGGKPCLRCGQVLQILTVAGRTTVVCPRCQKRR